MPTYLRWIAAITAGITARFAYFIAVGAIAVGTDNRELDTGIGILVTFGDLLVTVLPVLGVNDWLARRYPRPASPSDSR